jgi:DNA-binding CsgD family transcriptional regulator
MCANNVILRVFAGRDHAINELTERETEVMQWIQRGKTNWEISRILCISERTVKFHVQNSLAKLGASTRSHAIAIALKRGFIEL